MVLKRRRKGVHPMRGAEKELERASGHHVLQPHGDDNDRSIDRPFHFAPDLGELFACLDSNKSMTLVCSIAVTIDSPQSEPGRISRGAIQHLMPLASRRAQAASAARLSAEE